MNQNRVKVLGKVTLRGGRIVRQSGCTAKHVAASPVAVRLLSSDSVRYGSGTMAHAFRKALA